MNNDLVKRLRQNDHFERVMSAEQAADRIEELEAKLAKAVGTLHEIAGKKDFADDPWSIARTTLTELTGGKDE